MIQEGGILRLCSQLNVVILQQYDEQTVIIITFSIRSLLFEAYMRFKPSVWFLSTLVIRLPTGNPCVHKQQSLSKCPSLPTIKLTPYVKTELEYATGTHAEALEDTCGQGS